MPRNLAVSILLGFVSVIEAYAGCPCVAPGVSLDQAQITTLLDNSTVCAVVGPDRWQEWHSGGRVYELGNNSSGEDVGAWSTSVSGETATVTYSYGTGGSGGIYTYSVCQQGASYDFCGAAFGGRNVTNASVNAQTKGGC